MKAIITISFILLMLCGKGQFFSHLFLSSPDSAAVYMNGQKVGHTPCVVKYNWKESKPSGSVVIEIKADGFETYTKTISSKPREMDHAESIVLNLLSSPEDQGLTKQAVRFDKLLADQFSPGRRIGYHQKIKGEKEDLTWEGRVKVGEKSYEKAFYQVADKAGVRTPATAEIKLFSAQDQDKPQDARYVLSARLLDYQIRVRDEKVKVLKANYSAVVTDMEFEWQMLDLKTDKVVFTYQNRGVAREKERMYNARPDNLRAFKIALNDVFMNDDFIAILNADTPDSFKGKENQAGDGDSREISLKKVSKNPRFEKMSEMIKHSEKSCVTIVTDKGHGSGVFVSADGYVMTAYHVIQGAVKMKVRLSEGFELDAERVAFDKAADIALLKVPGSGYKPLPLNIEGAPSLGEDVVTIGTPASVELGQSVSKGIVSGKRQIEDEVFIQANISVSPGNSGGPLLNEAGEIIGIISWKIVGEGIEGIGFAIPSDVAVKRLNVKVE